MTQKDNLQTKINKNILKKLDKDTYETKSVNAINLLTYNRFDLLAKYLYVKFKDKNIDSEFGKEIYLEHIKAFNGFVESDESNKVGKDSFLKSFDNLIESLKKDGFAENSLIPLSSNSSILDGAHRTAASIYFENKVNIMSSDLDEQIFDYKFFEERGLKRKYLDSMAYEYAKLKDNTFMILLWPSSNGKEKELKNILDNYGNIIYRKDIFLTKNGSVNIVRKAYKFESWVGSNKDNFIGAQNKAEWCFNQDGPLRVVLFESTKDLIEMKEEIRELYNIKKHAVHINDTKEETLELAGLLFNENSINWLNFSNTRYFSWFDRLFNHYKKWLKSENLNKEDFCIDGSSSMSIYGLREARDLDYLNYGDNILDTGFKEIGCHNDELKYHPINKDEIIYNPNNHLFIDGYKFISLENIKLMKLKRNETKDIKDVDMIKALLSNKKIAIPFSEKVKPLLTISYWKGKIKFILLKIRYFLTLLKEKRNV
jgi:hypothetical protein